MASSKIISWLLKENALISNQFLLTHYLMKFRNISLENFHLDIPGAPNVNFRKMSVRKTV